MGVLGAVGSTVRSVPGTAWRVAVAPKRLAGAVVGDRRNRRFLAVVVGSAAFGVVDWPVAGLVGGAYLLARRSAAAAAPAGTDIGDPLGVGRLGSDGQGARVYDTDDLLEDVLVETVVEEFLVEEALLEEALEGAREEVEEDALAGEALEDAFEDALVEEIVEQVTDVVIGASVERVAPWPGYEGMTAAQVVERLVAAGTDAVTVLSYERAGRGRKTVLAAAEQAVTRAPGTLS